MEKRLLGVAFLEKKQEDGSHNVVCHGPKSSTEFGRKNKRRMVRRNIKAGELS